KSYNKLDHVVISLILHLCLKLYRIISRKMRDPTNVATKAADKVFSSADFCNRLYLINNAPSEHHLRPQQHFVEFIVTGSRICTTELRPSVNGVEHQLEMVAFDVIVQP